MKVMMIMNTQHFDGCVYYRNLLPAMYINSAGLGEVKAVDKIQSRDIFDKETKEILAKDYNVGFLQDVDIVMFSRFYGAEYEEVLKAVISAAQHFGCKIVYETDDDVINIPDHNPVAESAQPAVPLTKYILEHADAYTVTTKRLGDVLNAEFKKPTFVLPNSVEMHRFESKMHHRNSDDEIRIGWSGGRTHGRDISLMFDGVKKLLKEYKNLTFVALCPKGMHDLMDFEHEWFPFVPVEQYPAVLSSLDVDISLIPLEENKFNAGKSPIKWVEFSTVKAASVYSPVAPYSDFIEDEATGLAVKDNDWYTPIKRLIDDVKLRKELSDCAYREVESKFNMEKNVVLWYKAYQEVLNLPKN